MRVLVLFAHPVETSFGASLHATVVETLRARGHEVDDCDLNAEGFDPVMTRQDRLDYYDVPGNRGRVAPYVDRLLKSDALVFSFPVWNMGFPAILKGFVDKVFLPGVSFNLKDDGVVCSLPAQHQKARRGLHLWRSPLDDLSDGRPAAPVPQTLHASELRAGRALRLSRAATTWITRRLTRRIAFPRRRSNGSFRPGEPPQAPYQNAWSVNGGWAVRLGPRGPPSAT